LDFNKRIFILEMHGTNIKKKSVIYISTLIPSIDDYEAVSKYGKSRYFYLALWMVVYGIDMIYLTAVGLKPHGSSTVHIYTQTIHRTAQFTN